MKPVYLGWDLDETIGSFRPGSAMKAVAGVRPLIEGLRSRGCRHVLTTGADEGYGRAGLERAGVADLFERVFGAAHLPCSPSKCYRGVVTALGMGLSEAQDRMIIVGNSEIDIPSDIDLVTVLHPSALESGARVLGLMLSELVSGSPVWWEFERLLSREGGGYRNEFFDGASWKVGGTTVYAGRIKENPLVPKVERLLCIGGPAV
jgi:hypothetical protein